jgi:hypothetical protein
MWSRVVTAMLRGIGGIAQWSGASKPAIPVFTAEPDRVRCIGDPHASNVYSAEMPLLTLASLRFDGRKALARVIEQSDYGSLAQAVASLTVFAHPQTVAQTGGSNIFRTVRRRQQRDVGTFGEVPQCEGSVMLDDNRSPAVAFEWVHGIRERPDVQANHVWARSQDVTAYTALPNLCLTPAFLAKLTDTDETIRELLRYRAYDLFHYWPEEGSPSPPAAYHQLTWAEPVPPVSEVEGVLRAAMRTKPKDRVVRCARELGWLFSQFEPDPTL